MAAIGLTPQRIGGACSKILAWAYLDHSKDEYFRSLVLEYLHRADIKVLQLFESQKICDTLIEISGKDLPQLLHFIKRATTLVQDLPITATVVDQIVREERNACLRKVRTEHYPILEALKRNGKIENLGEYKSLIEELKASRIILENSGIYYLHPAIKDWLFFTESTPSAPLTVGTEEWGWMNRRRANLIRKKNRQGLTAQELEEFERLQHASHAALEAAFPRPSVDEDSLRQLRQNLQTEAESQDT